jgi:hypothetical protein
MLLAFTAASSAAYFSAVSEPQNALGGCECQPPQRTGQRPRAHAQRLTGDRATGGARGLADGCLPGVFRGVHDAGSLFVPERRVDPALGQPPRATEQTGAERAHQDRPRSGRRSCARAERATSDAARHRQVVRRLVQGLGDAAVLGRRGR